MGECFCDIQTLNRKLFLVFTSRIVKSYLVSAPVSITATCTTVIIVFNSHFCMHAMQFEIYLLSFPHLFLFSCKVTHCFHHFGLQMCMCMWQTPLCDIPGLKRLSAVWCHLLDTIQRISHTYNYRYRSARMPPGPDTLWHVEVMTRICKYLLWLPLQV